jgi:hypothetical protein
MNLAENRIIQISIIALLGMSLLFGSTTIAEEGKGHYNLPPGVYLELTEDFYQALKHDTPDNVKRYHNKSSDDYLRQIAVSSRFMVETNIQILKQQERILQMLESIAAKQSK